MTSKLDLRLKRAIPWAVFDGVFNAVYSAAMVLILGWFFLPSDLGLATVAQATAQLVEAAYSGGIQESMVRARCGHTRISDTAHCLAVAFSFAGMVVCGLVSIPLAYAYHSDQIVWLTLVAAATLPLNGLASIPSAILIRKMRTPLFTRRLVAAKLLSLTALILGALFKLGPWSIILASLASSSATLVLLYVSLTRWPRLRWTHSEARTLFRYGLLSSADLFCWIATSRLFSVLFGIFHGTEALGNFQFAQRLLDEIAALVQTAVGRLSLSYFAQLERTKGDMASAFQTGTRLLNTFAAPIFTGLALVASDLIPAAFNPRWASTIPYIWILAAVWVLAFSRILVPPILKAQGRPGLLLSFGLVKAVYAMAVVTATSGMAPIAAVLGWGSTELAMAPWCLIMAQRYLSVPLGRQIVQVLPALMAAAVMCGAVFALQHAAANFSSWHRLMLSIAAGFLSYSAAIYLIDGKQLLAILSQYRARKSSPA
jgi:O-antigen/teichoic acid export membrane protein